MRLKLTEQKLTTNNLVRNFSHTLVHFNKQNVYMLVTTTMRYTDWNQQSTSNKEHIL